MLPEGLRDWPHMSCTDGSSLGCESGLAFRARARSQLQEKNESRFAVEPGLYYLLIPWARFTSVSVFHVGPTGFGLKRLGLSFGASLSPCPVVPTVFGALVLWAYS